MKRTRHRRRRSRNDWKKHPYLHARAARKGWRRRKAKRSRRKGYGKKTGKKYIRFRGHRVSWMGLVKKLGVLGAKRRWRKSKKIRGKR